MRRPERIARQAGRPSGWLGRVLARVMAFETAAANAAAVDRLDLAADDRVLEIGIGHGRTLERLAPLVPHGVVAGVDHAADMCRMAARRCAALIAAGRVTVQCADGAQLPFPGAHFDKALAVHTLYFWQPLEPYLREIRRVLAPGGRLVLAYRPAGTPGTADFPAAVYTFHTPDAVQATLTGAGFDRIASVRHGADLVLTVAHAPSGRASEVTP